MESYAPQKVADSAAFIVLRRNLRINFGEGPQIPPLYVRRERRGPSALPEHDYFDFREQIPAFLLPAALWQRVWGRRCPAAPAAGLEWGAKQGYFAPRCRLKLVLGCRNGRFCTLTAGCPIRSGMMRKAAVYLLRNRVYRAVSFSSAHASRLSSGRKRSVCILPPKGDQLPTAWPSWRTIGQKMPLPLCARCIWS